MNVSVLLTVLAVTLCSIFAALSGFGTHQARQALSAQNGEAVTEE